uniref:Uncharacterized protein n=1 Tax=Rhizophora mucronata TaxID=61149 RepID=A0A2P2NC53_RHIMU
MVVSVKSSIGFSNR